VQATRVAQAHVSTRIRRTFSVLDHAVGSPNTLRISFRIELTNRPILSLIKVHYRRPPFTTTGAAGPEIRDTRQRTEQRDNSALQSAGPLAVNDADFKNPSQPALLQVFGNQLPDLIWSKSVQIQTAVYGDFDRIRTFGVTRHIC
jgi:hypothetical protein